MRSLSIQCWQSDRRATVSCRTASSCDKQEHTHTLSHPCDHPFVKKHQFSQVHVHTLFQSTYEVGRSKHFEELATAKSSVDLGCLNCFSLSEDVEIVALWGHLLQHSLLFLSLMIVLRDSDCVFWVVVVLQKEFGIFVLFIILGRVKTVALWPFGYFLFIPVFYVEFIWALNNVC